MDETILMRTCLTQLAALGHDFDEDEGYPVDINRNFSDDTWSVEIVLDWDTSWDDWISFVNCTITNDLIVQKCVLLERDGDIIEKFRYPAVVEAI